MSRIIGLQTPHYAPNYGAKLQAFAIAEALRNMGYEIEYINRRPLTASMLRNPFSRMLHGIEERNRKDLMLFEDEYLQPQTKAIYNNDDFTLLDTSKYYAIVVGSDQMWRDDYYHAGFEMTPYLFYADNLHLKRVAYAVSFGKSTCVHPEERRREIERLIHKFDALSVRENSGIDILRQVYHTNGICVCDPTLLHEAETYIKKLSLRKKDEEELQVATYILDNTPNFFRCANRIAKCLQLPIKNLLKPKPCGVLYRGRLSLLPQFYKKPSVTEWLNQILNAKYIVTDSYHGMLFSVIFHKQFVVYDRAAGGSERYKSILSYIGLEDRLFHKEDDIKDVVAKLQAPIDYQTVEEILNKFRTMSLEYLHSSLSKTL